MVGKETLEKFTDDTNRSVNQTKFLLELLDNDFSKLVELEEKLKNNHVSGCPGDKEECDKVLNMSLPERRWFNLDKWK